MYNILDPLLGTSVLYFCKTIFKVNYSNYKHCNNLETTRSNFETRYLHQHFQKKIIHIIIYS